jgi:hypothetical protein
MMTRQEPKDEITKYLINMKIIKIIWSQKVDLILFVVLIYCLIRGIGQEDWVMLGGALLIAIGNKTFDFINKVKLIYKGII